MEFKALKDIAKITMGQSPDSSSYNEEKEGLPFFQGNADFGELYPNERVWCNEPKKVAEPGDILISVRAPIGALNYAKDKCCIGRGLAAITIEDEAERNYVFHLLKARNNDLNQKGTGSTFKAIGKNVLEEVAVPQISRDEQQKCMDMMDLLESIIRERKSQLDKLDELIKARFVEMFGDPFINNCNWAKLKIAQAVTVEPQNGMYKPQSDYVTDDTGIPILRIDGFYDGKVTNWTTLKRLNCSNNDLEKYLLVDDDIVINRVNSIEYLGKCAHITGMIEPTVYESNMMRMHFDAARFNPIYITRLLCTQYVYDQIVNHAKKAVNQASINQKDVLDFDVYQPPKELQDQFADFVKQIDKSKVVVQKALDTTKELFDSLMQEYFG